MNCNTIIFQWFCFSVERSERHHTSYKTPSPALWRINNWQSIWMSSTAGLKKHHSQLLQTPDPLHCRSVMMTYARSLERTREGRHQAQTVCHQSVWNPVLTSCPPHLHKDLQQSTGAVRSPLMLQTLHHQSRP